MKRNGMRNEGTFVGAGLLALLGLCLIGAGGAPSGSPPTRGTAQDPIVSGAHYYNGDERHTVALDASRLSVRFEAAVTADAVRRILSEQPEVDAARLAALEIAERNWCAAPLVSGLSQAQILALSRALESRDDVVYAQPSVVRTGEWLGLTHRLLVSFGKRLDQAGVQRLLGELGLRAVRALDYVDHGYLLEMEKLSGRTTLELSAAIHERGLSEWSLPEFVVERVLRYTPNDTNYGSQWHLHSTGQGGAKVDADVDAPEAWDVTKGDASVIAAIIDGGIEYTHQDLTGGFVGGYDFLQNDTTPLPSGTGDNHGTSVAGVTCARGNNALGVTGIAFQCRFMPIRLVGVGQTTTDEADAIAFAKNNGAAVMNNSWGPPDGTGANYPLPANVKAAIDDAVTNGRAGKGCVIFWASGNGDESVELDGYAKYANVIAVGASTDQDLRAYYSDFGPSLDIAAPSNGGVTSGIWTTDRTGTAGYSSTNYTSTFGGTSSASPLACGVGALVISKNPSLTFAQVYAVLTSTADKIDTAGGGYVGGFSTLYGYGRVNAFQAVNAAGSPPIGGGGFQNFTSTDVPKAIPDNNPTGVTSILAISGVSGTVVDLDASVNITHTYKGDLKVTLIHPDGTQVLLHNQTGGAGDNVITTYDTLTLPAQALSALFGKAVNGTWKLKVQDVVAQDIGTLQGWSLSIKPSGGGGGPQTAVVSSGDVPKSIPDNNATGVSSNLSLTGFSGALQDVNVTMNIAHTYKGDLRVTLIHPDGTQVIVHNQSGGSADNVATTYDTLTAPFQSLAAFNGKSPGGTWQLKVQDLAALDVGTLNSWSLQVTYQ